MRLRVVGDAIVTDDLVTVAVFDPQLLPTLRDRAEELLMRGGAESDWDLQQRCYEQQDEIDKLNDVIADLKFEIAELLKELAKA